MDRNTSNEIINISLGQVATREGGVDRNMLRAGFKWSTKVATREGGVDRNLFREIFQRKACWSPPARVAWIETVIKINVFVSF